jgi:uncharacterized Zn-binding protein involved in type VI secretion
MPEAARLGDPIGHSPTMSWLLKGLLIGAGVALVGVAIVGTGGLAAVAIVGGAAAAGAGIGEVMSTMSFAPKEVVGQIIEGSRNVYIRGKKAARAHVDHAECSKHPKPPKVIATGSGNVYINGMPAARVGDKTECGAEITAGAGNVFIGGGTQQTDAISPENLVPGWVHAALLVVGLGSAVILAGPVIAAGGLIGGMLGGLGGDWVGGKLFGEGSDGQKWSMLAGSFVGGWFGAKGGAAFNRNYAIKVEGVGSNFGNVRIVPRPKIDPKVTWKPSDFSALGEDGLPIYDGKTTYGKLEVNGETHYLKSGVGEPGLGARLDPNIKAGAVTPSHVEGHASMIMRETGASKGVLSINHPQGTCGFCDKVISNILTEGSELTVRSPVGESVYVGNGK